MNQLGGKLSTIPSNSCNITQPTCFPAGCSLATGVPVSVNQVWVKDAGICGFSCNVNYSGSNCEIYNPVFSCGTSSIVDADGNSYNTVFITAANQCWMQSNLRTTKNPDGSLIAKGPTANNAVGWSDNTTKYYSCPPNTTGSGEDCSAISTKGLLYQWSAAMSGSTTEGAQ